MKQLFHSQEDFDLRYLTLFAVVNFLFTCLLAPFRLETGLEIVLVSFHPVFQVFFILFYNVF